jgi:hypothetical protein
MDLRFLSGHPEDFEEIARQMAEAQASASYLTARQQQVAATLLEAASRLGEGDRQQLRIDLVDMANAEIASDSYTHPWGDLIFKPETVED